MLVFNCPSALVRGTNFCLCFFSEAVEEGAMEDSDWGVALCCCWVLDDADDGGLEEAKLWVRLGGFGLFLEVQ